MAEAKLNADLSHRNIVRFLGVSSVEPNLGMVLEYVDGGTMKQRCVRFKIRTF